MKKLLALAAAGALVTAPATATAAGAASALSVAQQDTGGGEGLFGSPEATVGVIIFSVVTVFGLMVAFGVFDEDDDRSVSA